MKISMPYFGELSINRMYVYDRFGRNTMKVKPEVEEWMEKLGKKVSGLGVSSPVTITLFGRFKDGRHPDLGNLHKALGDGLKKGLWLDDKEYLIRDIGWEEDALDPSLEIEILE